MRPRTHLVIVVAVSALAACTPAPQDRGASDEPLLDGIREEWRVARDTPGKPDYDALCLRLRRMKSADARALADEIQRTRDADAQAVWAGLEREVDRKLMLMEFDLALKLIETSWPSTFARTPVQSIVNAKEKSILAYHGPPHPGEAEAKRRFEAYVQFRREHPADLEGQRRLLQSLAGDPQLQFTAFGQEARRELERLEQEAEGKPR